MPFGARGWSDDDGCDGKMLLGVRGWSDDDGFGGKMLLGARGWSDDDGCGGKMLLGARGWSDDDGFGGKMLLGARGWSGGCDGTMGDSAVGVAARSGDEWLTFERSSDTPSHRLTIIVPLLCPPARSSLDSTLCSSSPPPSL